MSAVRGHGAVGALTNIARTRGNVCLCVYDCFYFIFKRSVEMVEPGVVRFIELILVTNILVTRFKTITHIHDDDDDDDV